ncbi:MAG TPA: ATP-binding cassette domain-containing protein, partial [Stellaceae bacterium]|nr:ATP-binding cassette domain-containing protein [Stellaceae bacterium]
ERAELTKAAIVAAIVGDGGHRQVERECRSETLGRTVIKVRDLKGPHLDGVSLQAAAGEVLGIYGLVGSGRTRFLRTLMGLEPMTGGALDLAGQPYTPRAPTHAQKAGIAFLSEERKRDGFIPQMSALRNVVLPTLGRYRRAGLVDHRGAEAAARTLLGRIATRGHLERPIKTLSGGNQQKVLFGRIIEQDAQLILLDEPTKGVDIGAKADIYDIIRKLAGENRCVIVVSSEEEELLDVADRVIVFQHGRCDGRSTPITQASAATLRQAAWSHGP